MKTTGTMVIVFGIFAGCIAVKTPEDKSSRFIFPESSFVEEGATFQLEEIKHMLNATNTHDVVTQLERFVTDAQRELNDPFIVERLHFVRFESSRPGQTIADFLSRTFTDAGWKEVRGILTVEQTLGGGDWLRVYSHGNQQVLIHVIGAMKQQEDEMPDSFVVRTITFRFRGLKPEDVLGQDFRKKQEVTRLPSVRR